MKEMNSKCGIRGAQKISEPCFVPVIMAGGKSSRMGCDKAFLPWGAMNLFERLLREFSVFGRICVTAASDGRIPGFLKSIGYIVSTKDGNKEDFLLQEDLSFCKTASFGAWGMLAGIKNLPAEVTVLYDETSDRGPIEGLRRAAENIDGWFMAIAVDMPFVDCEFADYLRQFACGSFDAVVPLSKDRENPLCALYRSEGIREIARQKAADGIGKIRLLLESVRTKYADLKLSKFSGRVLLNANTPEDFENIKGPVPACIAVSGYKNSGKTTLAAELIKKFSALGFAVGAVKHDGHDYEMDRKGTDTHEFTDAGALASSIFSSNKWSINSSFGEKSMEAMLRSSAAACEAASENTGSSLDIILAEGDKKGCLPKIVLASEDFTAAAIHEAFGPNVVSIAVPERIDKLQVDKHQTEKNDFEIFSRDDVDGIFAAAMRTLVIIYPWLAAKKVCRPYLPKQAGLQAHETD